MTTSERPAAPVFANTRSDRVTAVRKLAGRSARSRPPDRLVVEGPQAVKEAADAAAVLDLWITPDQMARLPGVLERVKATGGYVHPATADVVAAMASGGAGGLGGPGGSGGPGGGPRGGPSADGPRGGAAQGVLAVARWPEPGLDDVFGDGQPALVAVVEECRDPGNAGTIIRAADAAGAAGVIFTAASVDVRSGKVIRASAGSLFHLPVVQGPTLAEALAAIRAAGLQVLAAHPSGREAAPDLHAPTAWLFGNEAHGLSAQAREAADGIVGIPMYGRAESLNLAMAATLCLYASATAQGAGDELWNNVRRV